jgi:hypothetical protein
MTPLYSGTLVSALPLDSLSLCSCEAMFLGLRFQTSICSGSTPVCRCSRRACEIGFALLLVQRICSALFRSVCPASAPTLLCTSLALSSPINLLCKQVSRPEAERSDWDESRIGPRPPLCGGQSAKDFLYSGSICSADLPRSVMLRFDFLYSDFSSVCSGSVRSSQA